MTTYKTISFALLATWAACALVEKNDRAGLVRSAVAIDVLPKKAAPFQDRSRCGRLKGSGHIHTGLHGGVDFEGSRIYNVSRLDERYEIAYDPTWVDI